MYKFLKYLPIITLLLSLTPVYSIDARPVILIEQHNSTHVVFTVYNPTNEYLLKNKIAIEIFRNDTWEGIYSGVCQEFTLFPGENKTFTCKLPALPPGIYAVFISRYIYLDFQPEGIYYNFFYLKVEGKSEDIKVIDFKLLTSELPSQENGWRYIQQPSQPVKVEIKINSTEEKELILEWYLYKRSELSGMGLVEKGEEKITLNKGESAYIFTFKAPSIPYLYELKTCLKTLNDEYIYCEPIRFRVKGRSGFVGKIRLFKENSSHKLLIRTFPSMDMNTPVNLSLEITAKTKNKEYKFDKTYSTSFEKERNVFWNENFELREKPLEIKFVLRDKNTGEVYHRDVIEIEKAEAGLNVYLIILVIVVILIGVLTWQKLR